jgi:hypothetical protein
MAPWTTVRRIMRELEPVTFTAEDFGLLLTELVALSRR